MNPVRIKVCGLTSVREALACAEAGADWIGLNFHPASPRSIAAGLGAEIASSLVGKAEVVGLFVDRPVEDVAALVDRVGGLEAVQLHGREDVAYLQRLSRTLPRLKVVRAFRLAGPDSVDRMIAYLNDASAIGCPPHAILVDADVPGLLGGTGHAIPFDVLDHLPAHPRLILAGGLTSENVAGRVARVRPWMVDVASGVESRPGVKDPTRVSAFISAARGS